METNQRLDGPEDLEAPKTHHFKVKAFKKVKPCGICRQAITREGCVCKDAVLLSAIRPVCHRGPHVAKLLSFPL
ncbi:hypothetical protein LTLLF_138855 [Microtus ochrogaster]|uniref:Uncharacterized protein n=1 Tax=Microtus ochrogaster TaxID=79684 RepID=A0A8J6GNA3_MICOH|nr:hypothetical protein LTLLF_138855 [Microtus ochrogaster]